MQPFPDTIEILVRTEHRDTTEAATAGWWHPEQIPPLLARMKDDGLMLPEFGGDLAQDMSASFVERRGQICLEIFVGSPT